jgi:hypothetical protein
MLSDSHKGCPYEGSVRKKIIPPILPLEKGGSFRADYFSAGTSPETSDSESKFFASREPN